MKADARLPPSATGPLITLATLLGAAAGSFLVFGVKPGWSHEVSALVLICAVALPCSAAELVLRHLRREGSFDFSKPRLSGQRLIRKIAALWGIFAILVLFYSLLPLYRTEFYQPFHWLLRSFLPAVLLLSIPYLALTDAYQRNPEDSLHAMGERLLNPARPLAAGDVNYLLGWAVKGFFLPLMFGYLCGQIGRIAEFDHSAFSHASLQGVTAHVFEFLFAHIFFLDVLVATTGYLMTLRLLGTEIRSVEPTAAGWMAALACYEPFWSIVSGSFLAYTHEGSWGSWLHAYPVIYVLWAAAIIFLLSIYLWATLVFGIRFSNLTHRGIITSGPYRFTKHPAYIAKNISWWLISIPFMPADGSPWTALQLSLGLAGVNAIYVLRARTEERHLLRDPAYREYAAWIGAHGIFRRLPFIAGKVRQAVWMEKPNCGEPPPLQRDWRE